MNKKKIVLENGREFYGIGFGADVEQVSELVVNTSMVGYQEVISDLAYAGQMVVMTYPLIGNYGINDEDSEARQPLMGGLIVREYNDNPSNFRFTKTLAEEMEECGIPGIAGIDTRALTRIVRDEGTQKVLITNTSTTKEDAMQKISAWQMPHNLLEQVSCKKRWYARTPSHQYTVAVLDCGMRLSAVQAMKKLGCNVTVLPYNTTAEEICTLDVDGVFISSGAGNPEDATPVIETVKKLTGKLPMLGAGLGHQIVALAFGATVQKITFGHSSTNHPVKNMETGNITIESQHNIYKVVEESLKNTGLQVTHKDVLDGTVVGLKNIKENIFAVQYNPGKDLFEQFVNAMEQAKGGRNNA